MQIGHRASRCLTTQRFSSFVAEPDKKRSAAPDRCSGSNPESRKFSTRGPTEPGEAEFRKLLIICDLSPLRTMPASLSWQTGLGSSPLWAVARTNLFVEVLHTCADDKDRQEPRQCSVDTNGSRALSPVAGTPNGARRVKEKGLAATLLLEKEESPCHQQKSDRT
jgi:hypothetical protein